MNAQQHVLLLVGSVRRPRSTSESLGTYLVERLGERGFEAETLLLHRALKSDKSRAELLTATDRADLLVIAFPLYVDSLPFLVIQAMELVAQHRRVRAGGQRQRLMVIINCGFPEAQHNDAAQGICQQFAREAGFEWAGGLSMGGGSAINGQALSEVQGMARNVIKALDLSAEALAAGKSVPPEALGTMSKPIIPSWAYILMGGWGWKRQAKKHGVNKQLRDRPYRQA